MKKLLAVCLALALPLIAQPSLADDAFQLQDRMMIAEQLSRYSQLWDRKDSEGVVQLLTEDGSFEWHLTGAEKQPPVVKGRENVLKYARQAHEKRLAGKQSRHHFTGLLFEELSETEARTEHMMLVTQIKPGEKPVVTATGVYHIDWKKTDEGWLMYHRKLYVDR